jgi:hypothetical protein
MKRTDSGASPHSPHVVHSTHSVGSAGGPAGNSPTPAEASLDVHRATSEAELLNGYANAVHVHDPNADVITRVDAIATHVDHLVEELVALKSHLVEVELVPWLSYRLAVTLSRVDHAAAEIVIQQSARLEAEALAGQLPAFPELDAELELDPAEPTS